jgi:hypothetical protein
MVMLAIKAGLGPLAEVELHMVKPLFRLGPVPEQSAVEIKSGQNGLAPSTASSQGSVAGL